MNDNLILIISNIATGIGAWFVSRKRQQAETDNQVLKNLELSINLYKEVIDDLKIEIGQLKRRIQELEEKIDELHAENKRLKGHL